MAEDDEIINVEENINFTEAKIQKDNNTNKKIKEQNDYTKVSTSEDATLQGFDKEPINKKSCDIFGIKKSCQDFKANHRLGETIAFYEDSMGNPRFIIGPDCKII